jgi:predicted amidophosphoribosyltransferase
LSPENRFRTICNECFSHIPIRTGCLCAICERRIPDIFGRCRCAESLTLAAASLFECNEIQNLIRALKYDRIREAALPLGYLLSRYLEESALPLFSSTESILLLPIPLHTKKERVRGFNQSLLIAQAFLHTLPTHHITIHTDILFRNKNTPSQTIQPSHRARKENLAGAFTLQNSEQIKGCVILLLDDVSTSGATLCEALRCVKTAHPKCVIGLTIAKA